MDNNKCEYRDENKYICELHKTYDVRVVYPLSPGRFKCLHCKKNASMDIRIRIMYPILLDTFT